MMGHATPPAFSLLTAFTLTWTGAAISSNFSNYPAEGGTRKKLLLRGGSVTQANLETLSIRWTKNLSPKLKPKAKLNLPVAGVVAACNWPDLIRFEARFLREPERGPGYN